MSSGGTEEPRWLTAEQQVSWRSFLLGSARLTEALNRQLEADSGISLSEYEILVRLSEAPECTIRMSELAAAVVQSRSRLTHTVTRMEKQGLVRRETCLADGRGVNCVLTDEGFAFLRDAAPGHVQAVRDNLVDLLSDEHFTVLGQAMAVVARGPGAPATPRAVAPAAATAPAVRAATAPAAAAPAAAAPAAAVPAPAAPGTASPPAAAGRDVSLPAAAAGA